MRGAVGIREPSGGCAPRAARFSGGVELRRERAALALGHRPDRLALGDRYLGEELSAADLPPAALAHQEVADRHVLSLAGAVEDHLGDVDLAERDPPLELGTGSADLIGAFQRTHVLWSALGDCRFRVHLAASSFASQVPAARNILTSP